MNTVIKPAKRIILPIVAIGALLCMPPVFAQQVDTSDWICEFCPFESGHDADYELGATSVSDDSAYFGNATGFDEEGVYANVDGEGAYAGDNHRLRWSVEDLALDSRVAELAGGRPGKFDYHLGWREIPQRRFDTTDAIFLQAAADTLSLPPGWVRAPTTAGFTELGPSLASRNIESDRSVLDLGASFLPTRRIRFSADFRRQERDGVGIYGGPYFTQSSLLPGPLDYTTDEADLDLRYIGDSGFLSLAWYLSDFQSNTDELRWENPFTSAAGSEFAALAQPPDSRFQQLSLSGSYGFSHYRTVVSFSAATGRIEQDQAFLPYTTNANLAVGPLPRSSLDGEVDTSNYAVNLSSRLFDKARIRLNYRYDERDNKTAQDLWTRVIADTFVSGVAEANIPYNFERSTLKLSADYDLFDTLRISGGYDRRTIDRDFQEVAEQTEDTGWGRARWRPNDTLDIDFRAGAAQRDIDRYDETLAMTFGQNPLLRKYNLAYRYRRFGELTVGATPPDSPFSVTLTGMYADDSYSRSQLGLTDADDLRVAADIGWTVSENASLYLTAGYESIKSEQFGSETFAAPDWRATNNDDFTTFGGGFRIRQIGGNVDLQLDYTRSDGTSEIHLASNANGQSRFPDLESTLDHLRVALAYQRSERLQLNASLRYQRFKADDWALEAVGPATIPTVLTLGANPYDDEVLIFGLGFRYSVGGTSTQAPEGE